MEFDIHFEAHVYNEETNKYVTFKELSPLNKSKVLESIAINAKTVDLNIRPIKVTYEREIKVKVNGRKVPLDKLPEKYQQQIENDLKRIEDEVPFEKPVSGKLEIIDPEKQ